MLLSILQDFCCSFVLLHEVAHVVCGHTRGALHFFGKPKVEEFFGIRDWLRRGRYLKTAWEYDADVVTASLLCQYIRHFIVSHKGPGVESAFRFVGANLANCLSE